MKFSFFFFFLWSTFFSASRQNCWFTMAFVKFVEVCANVSQNQIIEKKLIYCVLAFYRSIFFLRWVPHQSYLKTTNLTHLNDIWFVPTVRTPNTSRYILFSSLHWKKDDPITSQLCTESMSFFLSSTNFTLQKYFSKNRMCSDTLIHSKYDAIKKLALFLKIEYK